LFPFYRNDYKQILRFSQNKSISNLEILDVGCGNGKFISFNLSNNYTGIDLSRSALNKAQKIHPNSKWICGNFLEYEFPIQYDLIICFHTLSVIQSPEIAMDKMFKLLKPKGKLIIIDHQKNSKTRILLDKIGKFIPFGFRWNQNINLNSSKESARLIHFEPLNLWNKVAVFEKIS
jgi:2-polyprenyl-3-methyl-5-hydroxy-6-metoxy-1,4-benzoquinol methylase